MDSGLYEANFIDTKDIVFYDEIRKICEGNSCCNYGTSWACPPAVGTVEECRTSVLKYEKMLLFSKKYELEDSFDFEGMHDGLIDFKHVVDSFHERIGEFISNFLLLSNEGCGRCSKCTYPDSECRYPKLLHHSIEGYGLNISELARKAGIRYINGEGTVTFFGGLLFNTDN